MPRIKKAISLAEDFHGRIASMTKEDNRFSTNINKVLERYFILIDWSYPDFTTDEWTLCFDSMNGYFSDENQVHVLNSGILNIADHCQYNNTHENFNVDKDVFFKKLKNLTDIEKFSVLDICERFWGGTNDWGKCENYSEVVRNLQNRTKREGSILPSLGK